jgi:hypothetical protein
VPKTLETCASCGREIGETEEPHVSNDLIVCAQCADKLSVAVPSKWPRIGMFGAGVLITVIAMLIVGSANSEARQISYVLSMVVAGVYVLWVIGRLTGHTTIGAVQPGDEPGEDDSDSFEAECWTKVVGVTQKNDDGSHRQAIIARCKKRERLVIEHEPSNKYSPTRSAMRVLRENGDQLGYLSEDLAVDVRKKLKAGKMVWAVVERKTGGTDAKPVRGVNIHLRWN